MQQIPGNRNESEEKASSNPQRSGEQTPGIQETSGEPNSQQQNDEWKKGISTGSHEKRNTGNPSEPEGTSSIPLDKNDTIGNP
jgi:hypothetical protein